jgi:hypothetical protein
MLIPQGDDRWMGDRDEDMHKVWLESLTEKQYEALQATMRREREESEERLRSRPSSF